MRGNGEEIDRERERGFIMRSRWLQLPLFSQLSSPATREFTRRLHRFGYSFDHVADRGHLRRVLEEVNYARRKTVIHLQEAVERNDCELQITDFPRYDSTEPPLLSFRRPTSLGERLKFRKERGEAILRSRNNYCGRRKITNVWRNLR